MKKSVSRVTDGIPLKPVQIPREIFLSPGDLVLLVVSLHKLIHHHHRIFD